MKFEQKYLKYLKAVGSLSTVAVLTTFDAMPHDTSEINRVTCKAGISTKGIAIPLNPVGINTMT